jgi:hypothetical protein
MISSAEPLLMRFTTFYIIDAYSNIEIDKAIANLEEGKAFAARLHTG